MNPFDMRIVVVAPTHRRAEDYAERVGLRRGFYCVATDSLGLRGWGPSTLILHLVYDWHQQRNAREVRESVALLKSLGAAVIEVERAAEFGDGATV